MVLRAIYTIHNFQVKRIYTSTDFENRSPKLVKRPLFSTTAKPKVREPALRAAQCMSDDNGMLFNDYGCSATNESIKSLHAFMEPFIRRLDTCLIM